MNGNFLARFLLCMTFMFANVHAKNFDESKLYDSMQAQNYQEDFHLDNIDPEVFVLIKDQLESAKKVLIEIRNTQNPALIKKAAYSLGNIMKELVYISGAIALGGGSTTLGIALIVGDGVIQDIFRNPTGQGATLIVLPMVIFSVIITYAFLKLVFGRLLASPDKDAVNLNIKDALMHIDQTINKLNYEIKKVERLYALQKPKGTKRLA